MVRSEAILAWLTSVQEQEGVLTSQPRRSIAAVRHLTWRLLAMNYERMISMKLTPQSGTPWNWAETRPMEARTAVAENFILVMSVKRVKEKKENQ